MSYVVIQSLTSPFRLSEELKNHLTKNLNCDSTRCLQPLSKSLTSSVLNIAKKRFSAYSYHKTAQVSTKGQFRAAGKITLAYFIGPIFIGQIRGCKIASLVKHSGEHYFGQTNVHSNTIVYL